MNLPNALTVARIFLVPIVVAVLLTGEMRMRVFLGAGLFLAAALTDLLDGYLARRRKQVTTLGRLLDPIADKLLVSSVLITLTYYRLVPLWVTIILVAREFLINGLRSFYAMEGIAIYPSFSGKLKTALQIIGISCILFNVPEKSNYSMCDYLQYLGISCLDFNSSLRQIGLIIVYIALFFSIFSAIDYMKAIFKWPHSPSKKDQKE